MNNLKSHFLQNLLTLLSSIHPKKIIKKFTLILKSTLDNLTQPIIILRSIQDFIKRLKNLKILRILKILKNLRILRILRILKILKNFILFLILIFFLKITLLLIFYIFLIFLISLTFYNKFKLQTFFRKLIQKLKP